MTDLFAIQVVLIEEKLKSEYTFEKTLADIGLSEKEIGWVLAHLDRHHYELVKTRYMGTVVSSESESRAKLIWLRKTMTIDLRSLGSNKPLAEAIQDSFDWKKLWLSCEKLAGAICIKLPDSSPSGERYLFLVGPNKRCPEIPTPLVALKEEEIPYAETSKVSPVLRNKEVVQLTDMDRMRGAMRNI